jgi:hypothetical protein
MLSQGGNFFARRDKSRFLITDLQQGLPWSKHKEFTWIFLRIVLFCLCYRRSLDVNSAISKYCLLYAGWCTDKKVNKMFLIYEEIHMGSVAKSYN